MPDTKRTATGVLGGIVGLVGLSTAAAVLVTATITPAIAVTGYAASSAITMFDNLPEVLDIQKLMLPTNFLRKDYDTGQDVVFATFYDQDRAPVKFDEVSPTIYDAVLSSEDPRFYQHGGIDMIGTARALLHNAQGGGETQGASSVSQQYVKNVLIQRCEWNAVATEELSQEQVLANCWTDATNAEGPEGYQRKLQEMRYAIALEQKYSKNEILLGYLNISNFGGQTYGINAAARRYYNVDAANVTLGQAAALAGIVQNPNRYRIDLPGGTGIDDDGNPINNAPDGVVIAEGNTIRALDLLLEEGKITQEQYLTAADGYTATKGRQLYVLSRMLDDGKITQEQYDAAVLEPITPNIRTAGAGCGLAGGLAYFCKYVKDIIEDDPAFGATPFERHQTLQRGGLNVYTSLDIRLQAAADMTMEANVPRSVDWMQLGSTIASIEPSTGRILAIAQNTDFTEDEALGATPGYSSLVFAGDMKYGQSSGFAVGSTFKLFTLIDWLEKGHSINETLNGRIRVIKRLEDSCDGDWINYDNTRVDNFNKVGGYVGTPMQFTRDSLNSGFFAMAEKLDLCDIQNVATKMGATQGNGNPVNMDGLFAVIGPHAVSPIAMAGAYGTVANNGVYCQPRAIDRITDSDGNELRLPDRTCEQVIEPSVAATAAYALQGVMNGNGTGARGNPFDGTPMLGKTGTNEETQTWLIESSTKVATVSWVGNYDGLKDVFTDFGNARYWMTKDTQRVANALYGGDEFPEPDNNLTRRIMTDLPSVVGMSIDDATAALDDAGFDVFVGAPIDSSAATGTIAAQDPSGGTAPSGTTVTISPSNGLGASVPSVSGKLEDAVAELRAAGFTDVQPGTCTADPKGDNKRQVTGTTPAAGSAVNRNSPITVEYTTKKCP